MDGKLHGGCLRWQRVYTFTRYATGLGWSIVAGVQSFPGVSHEPFKIPSVWTIIGIAGFVIWMAAYRSFSTGSYWAHGSLPRCFGRWDRRMVCNAMDAFAYAHYIFPIHELPIYPAYVNSFCSGIYMVRDYWFKHRSIG